MPTTINPDMACPCGKGSYGECCGRYHSGHHVAPTAQAVMQSRYSAYVLGLGDYLLATWHPQHRPKLTAAALTADSPQWLKLNILSTATYPNGRQAEVEFCAHYAALDGNIGHFQERSYFQRYKGAWCYTQGNIISTT